MSTSAGGTCRRTGSSSSTGTRPTTSTGWTSPAPRRGTSPAGHSGGNTTLWSSWVIAGEQRRVYFGGDSGYTPAYADIGAAYGPFDLTVLPIGAYDPRWRDVHLDPEEAVMAHRALRGRVLLPIHWATFDLAFHEWGEPAEWVVRECAEHDVRLAMPPPGGRFQPGAELPTEEWWRASM